MTLRKYYPVSSFSVSSPICLHLCFPRPGSNYSDLSFEVGLNRGGDWHSDRNLRYLFLVLRPVIGKTLSRIPEKKFMLAGAILSVVTSIAYIFTPPFWPSLRQSRSGNRIGLLFYGRPRLYHQHHPGAYRGKPRLLLSFVQHFRWR